MPPARRAASRRDARPWRSAARVVAVAGALALGARPAAARAQSEPAGAEAAAFAEARAAFDRGLAALAAQRFGEAIPAFNDSYRLRAAPVVLYNLGIALRGVGRYVDAIAAFERYLSSSDPGLAAAQRSAIEREVLDMQRELGHATLVVEPADASVVVDGRPQSARRVTLDPGEHAIEALADGFVPRRLTVSLAPGAERLVEVRLVLAGAATSAPAQGRPRTSVASRGPVISPLVWFGVGAVALGAGGAAALGLYGDARFDALQTECDAALCTSTDGSFRARESQLGTVAIGVYALWAVAGVGVVLTTIGAVLSARAAPAASARLARLAADGVVVAW